MAAFTVCSGPIQLRPRSAAEAWPAGTSAIEPLASQGGVSTGRQAALLPRAPPPTTILTWLGRVVVVGLVDERGAVPQRVQVAHRLARVVPVRHLLGELEGQLQLLLHRQEHHARQRPVAGALVVAHLCRGGGGRQVVTGCTVAGAAASRTGGSTTLGVRAAAVAAAGRVRLVARPLTTTTFQPGSAAQALICSVGGAMLVMTIHLSCCCSAPSAAGASLSTNLQEPYCGSRSSAALLAAQVCQLSACSAPLRMAALSVLVCRATQAAVPLTPEQPSCLRAASSSCSCELAALLLPAVASGTSLALVALKASASSRAAQRVPAHMSPSSRAVNEGRSAEDGGKVGELRADGERGVSNDMMNGL